MFSHLSPDAATILISTSASCFQAAFIMSRLRKPPDDETQETLRTTSFPTAHIKEKWDNNLYIMGLAYGKTVS